MQARNRYPRSILRLITIIVILTVILSAVLVTESILEKKEPITFPFHNVLFPYVMFRPPSNTVWYSDGSSLSSRTGEVAIEYSNKDGLRIESSEYQLTSHKPKGQLRIAVIGGSTVRIGTRFDVTLPGALKRTLEVRFPMANVEVINAGIISAISRQELIYLITTLVDYDLDMLIVYDGINDSGQMLYYERRPNFPYNYSVMEHAWIQYTTAHTQSVWQHFVSRSAILSKILRKTGAQSNYLNPVSAEKLISDKALRASYAKAHIDNWERIRRICAAYDILPAFILQPTSLYDRYSDDTKPSELSEKLERNLYANYLVYEELRQSIQNFSKENPTLNILDFSSLLSADAFFDGAHVYDDVNDRIAAELAEHISGDVSRLVLSP